MMPLRLFVAIPLPDEARDALSRLQVQNDSVRWTSVPQLHITLRFIGSVPDEMVTQLARALEKVTATSFDVQIRGAGHFGNRILWAGVAENPALTELHAQVESAVQEAGVEPEDRPFHAHVTIARVKGKPRSFIRRFVSRNRNLLLRPFPVRSFALYTSTLHRDGAHHDVIQSFPLGHEAV